ncbi:MAG: BACON domain-containing carbohydrate-binding protein [Acidobacteriota bacterium]
MLNRRNQPRLSSLKIKSLFNLKMSKKLLSLSALVFLILGAISIKAIPMIVARAGSAKSKAKPRQVAAEQVTTRTKSSSGAWINLAAGREVTSEFSGNAKAGEALAKGLAKPLALAAGDFDGDGIDDLVGGFQGPDGGLIALWRGNVDAQHPNTAEAKARKQNGESTDAAYLGKAQVFEVSDAPELMVTGDFDNDGFLDVAFTNRGSNQLFVLPGTGKGGFAELYWLDLPDVVTALATGDVNRADGLADLLVGLRTGNLLVFEGVRGAINEPAENFNLPFEVTSISLEQMDTDGFTDVVVGGGKNLAIIHGRDRKISESYEVRAKVPAANVEQREFAFAIKAVSAGDFTGDTANDIALLDGNGAVQLLTKNTTTKKKVIDGLAGLQVKQLGASAMPAATQLFKTRSSSLPADGLALFGGDEFQIVVDGATVSRREAQQPVSVPATVSSVIGVDGGVAALLPVQINSDALTDYVLFRGTSTAPSVVPTALGATFTVTNTANTGAGSLRQAIIDANLTVGADTINFAIGSGLQTINLTADLPALTETVTVDGTTQPGFAGTPVIEINSSGATSGIGLKVSGGTSLIKGLNVHGFTLTGVQFVLVGNNKLEGCYLGTDPAGTAALPNGDGVQVTASNNTIGGTTAAARNLISGNNDNGVDISNSSAGNNLVKGNYIGTEVTGAAALPNQSNGVYILAKNNIVGGTTANDRNIISGNTTNGVRLLNDVLYASNRVQGNYIGTDAAGAAAVPNTAGGIAIFNSPTHTIGGTTTGAGNLIAGNTGYGILIQNDKATGILVQGNMIGSATLANGGPGVFINLTLSNTVGGTVINSPNTITNNNKGVVVVGASATSNRIRQNSITANTAMGIDLGDDGVTANDTLDPDAGANTLQNFPVLSTVIGGASTTITGTLNSTANTAFDLDFFTSSNCDRQGATFLGTANVTTNASGNATINVNFPVSLSAGQAITATATDPNGNTSEFSECVILCAYSINPTSQNFAPAGGSGSFDVTATGGCSWTATTTQSWITITSGASGTGNGTVNFTVAANDVASQRTGTITVASQGITVQTFTVTQDPAPCNFSIAPTSQSFISTGGSGTVSVTVAQGCAWTAVSNDAWITVTSGASGNGNGTVGYSVAAKTDPGPRTGTITIADQTFTVNQSGTDCTFQIAPTSQHFPVAGGTGSIAVTTPGVCDWMAVSNDAWIHITSGASGTGNGTVNFSVDTSTDPGNRTGSINVAGQTFTVTQDGTNPCLYVIAPTSQAFPVGGGSSSVAVTTGATCNWTAVSNSAFITVVSGAAGTGNGVVGFNVAANPTNAVRSGTITIAGLTFTVNQAGTSCVSTISPLGLSFTFSGGSGTFAVTALANCSWPVTTFDSFITITSSSLGSGSQKVKYTVAANPNPTPRTGYILVGGFVHTVSQAAAPNTCSYSINPTSQNFADTGGTDSVNVTAGTGCNWTAISNAVWITVTSGASGTGNGTVNYSVQANPNASPRSGTITIAGHTFTVNQAAAPGSCNYLISPTGQTFGVSGGSSTVNVTAGVGCNWTAVSNDAWITVTSGASGSGNGSVGYSVAANPNPSSRTGTMTIAGQTFTVMQNGNCNYLISPSGRTFTNVGGSSTVTVTTTTGCDWTATTSAGWIIITSGSGSGNGTVSYTVLNNSSGVLRTGTIVINGKVHTVKQNP